MEDFFKVNSTPPASQYLTSLTRSMKLRGVQDPIEIFRSITETIEALRSASAENENAFYSHLKRLRLIYEKFDDATRTQLSHCEETLKHQRPPKVSKVETKKVQQIKTKPVRSESDSEESQTDEDDFSEASFAEEETEQPFEEPSNEVVLMQLQKLRMKVDALEFSIQKQKERFDRELTHHKTYVEKLELLIRLAVQGDSKAMTNVLLDDYLNKNVK
jgi:hypothetical protein